MKTVYAMILLLAAPWLGAGSTKTAVYDGKSDFERGNLRNVAVTYDGLLMPAPRTVRLWQSDELAIWALIADSKERLYMSAGNQGRVYRRDGGKTELFFDAEEPMIFALAIDRNDHLYAAASPGGKIYKITPAGTASLFFDAKTDYTWDLKFDARGNLLAAVGKPARILQIDPRGQATTLYQGEEQHVRTLTIANDRLYFGTSGKGYVYQLKPGEKPFVLFDPKMEEVQQIIALGDGFLYASVAGRTSLAAPQELPQQTAAAQDSDVSGADEDELAAQMGQAVSTALPSSSLFRISQEGYGKDLWVGMDDRIQSMAPYEANSLLIGSGKSGKIYQMTGKGEASLLAKISESQVMSFLTLNRSIYFAAANAAKLYEMTAHQVEAASYESDVIDAGLSATFGKLACEGRELRGVAFFTRSGNTEQPSTAWSEWAAVRMTGEELAVVSPAARFFQWKCVFNDARAAVDKVTVSYVQTNLPPEVTFILVHDANEVYEAEGGARPDGIVFPAPLGGRQSKRGFRCIDWSFEDANLDRLFFHLHYRRLGDRIWRVLAKKVTVNVYSWDAMQMADGWYEIKVTASDSLANPPTTSLTGELISKPFLVDNTGPAIVKIKSETVGKKVLTFQVQDAHLPVERVMISVDAGPWQPLVPDDGLMDSKKESFTFERSGEGQEIAVKAEDRNGNVTVVHTK